MFSVHSDKSIQFSSAVVITVHHVQTLTPSITSITDYSIDDRLHLSVTQLLDDHGLPVIVYTTYNLENRFLSNLSHNAADPDTTDYTDR